MVCVIIVERRVHKKVYKSYNCKREYISLDNTGLYYYSGVFEHSYG